MIDPCTLVLAGVMSFHFSKIIDRFEAISKNKGIEAINDLYARCTVAPLILSRPGSVYGPNNATGTGADDVVPTYFKVGRTTVYSQRAPSAVLRSVDVGQTGDLFGRQHPIVKQELIHATVEVVSITINNLSTVQIAGIIMHPTDADTAVVCG